MTTAGPHMQEWLALLNADLAQMSPPRAAYEYDDAPEHGGNYVIAFLTRSYGGAARASGSPGTSSWRLSIRTVGVGVTNARVLLDRTNAVIEDAVITVGGIRSSPAQFQTDDPIRQDERNADLWSGLRSYTYCF